MSERAVNEIKRARVIACKKFLDSPAWIAAQVGSTEEAELLAEFIEQQRRAAIEAAAQRLEVLAQGEMPTERMIGLQAGVDAIRALKEAE